MAKVLRATSRHRVLGLRRCACPCGRLFEVTTKNPRQRWATPSCIPGAERSRWGREGRRQHFLRARQERWGALIAEARTGQIAWHEAFDRAYRTGYWAGFQAGEKSGAKAS